MKTSLSRLIVSLLFCFMIFVPLFEVPAADFNWKMSSWASKGNSSDDIFNDFAKQVGVMSGGRLAIRYTSAGEVVGEAETFDAVKSGLLDIAIPYPGLYAGAVPASQVEAGLPFSLNGALEIETLHWKRGWAEILRNDVYGPLGVQYIGPNIQSGVPLVSKKPVKTLADLKGLKIRSAGPQAKVLSKLGAKVVVVPYGEVYMALATGVVEGATCGSVGEGYDLKLYESAKNYLDPCVIPAQVCPVLVNMKAWKSLPPDLQRIVEIVARQNSQAMEIEMWHQDAVAMQVMRAKHGVTVHTLNAKDQATLRKVAEVIWDEYAAKDAASKKLIGVIKDYMKFLGYL